MVQLSTQTSGRAVAPSTPAIVFMAGFPDDHGSWALLAPQFRATHRVVTVVMPDFDRSELSPGHFWGYSFAEIVEGLRKIVDELKRSCAEVVLVGHDWGSFMCQLLVADYPELVDRLVLLDVGRFRISGLSTKNICVITMYQMFLAFVFLLSRLPIVGQVLATLAMIAYPWKMIGPCPYETQLPKRTSGNRKFFGHMCYPYCYFLVRVFGGKVGACAFPSMPLLYLSGKRKRASFHDESFVRSLAQTKHCRYKELDCGHFMQAQLPNEVAEEIQRFLRDTA